MPTTKSHGMAVKHFALPPPPPPPPVPPSTLLQHIQDASPQKEPRRFHSRSPTSSYIRVGESLSFLARRLENDEANSRNRYVRFRGKSVTRRANCSIVTRFNSFQFHLCSIFGLTSKKKKARSKVSRVCNENETKKKKKKKETLHHILEFSRWKDSYERFV